MIRPSRWLVQLRKFTNRLWFLPLLALLAAIDLFIILIPTDGLLITTVVMRKKHWIRAALWVSLGSTLGALVMGLMIHHYGEWTLIQLGLLEQNSHLLERAARWFEGYGNLALFVFAFGPFPMQPGVVMAALLKMPMPQLLAAVFLGRAIKYLFFAWAAVYAPHLLQKFFRIRREVKQVSQ